MISALSFRTSMTLVTVATLGILFPTQVHAGSIYLSPGSKAVTPGSTFSVAVRANMGGDLVNAAEANLSYPTDKLEYVGISAGGSAFPIDAASGGGSGGVRLSRGVIGQGVSGDRLIGTVTFRAKGQGAAAVGVSGSLLRGADQANVFSGGAGGTYTISTSAPTSNTTKASPSTTPLEISALTVKDISFNKATVSWKTDRPASSLVEYGLDTNYGLTAQSPALTADHSVLLDSELLTPGTTYHLRVKSVDNQKGEAISENLSFKTQGIPIKILLTDATNTPLANQLVTLVTPKETLQATTDASGYVLFYDLSPTQHTVVMEVNGAKTVQTIQIGEPTTQESTQGAITQQTFQVMVAGANTKKSPQAIPFIVAGLGILSALLAGYLWLRRRNKQNPPPPPAPNQTLSPSPTQPTQQSVSYTATG